MLVSVIADGVALLFMRTSIMTEKLARRGLRIHADYEPDILQQMYVRETMSEDVPAVPASMTVSALAEAIERRDPVLSKHHGVMIVDDEGHLTGIITRGDVLRGLETDPGGKMTVLEGGTASGAVTYPDDTLADAADTMQHHRRGRLTVDSRDK